MAAFDYVVVGAGTAGCVVASRLSEDASVSVLLIEAGPAQGPAAMSDPGGRRQLLGTEVDWAFTTVPQAGLGGKRLPLPAGRVLGGSSGINGMFHLRGHRANYAAWAAAGAAGWGYKDLLPYFRRSEQAPGGDPAVRGTDGPMIVTPKPRTNSGLIEALMAAAQEGGIAYTPDPSGAFQEGVGWHDWNIVDGKRQTAADAYIRPNMGRPNLTVLTGSLVRRLIIENGRCAGIEYAVGSQSERADAKSEVILAAGAIGTPRLLMVSGIGPGPHLKDAGIEVLVDAPGVGQNLHDHPMTSVVYQASEAALPAIRGRDHNAFNALLRTDPGVGEPDMLLVFIDAPYFSPSLNGPSDAYVIACSLVKPASRGSVRLAAPDITVPPLVDPNYLGEEADAGRLLAGIKAAQAIGARTSLKAWNEGELFPGPAAHDDATALEYLRSSIMPHFHYAGTCRMGSDSEAVVDPELRLRGVARLRVADASVMPSPVSANTNATVLAIAERAAALIRG